MPRAYRKTTRAATHEATRRRILDAAARSIDDGTFGVREIAKHASVTVQTIYAHFGSKAGLITAVVQDISMSHGLVAGLQRVWRQPDAREQLDTMVAVTFTFWHDAWPFIRYTLTAERQDVDFAAQKQALDASRLHDYERICEGLARSGALKTGLRPKTAAALMFTLCGPAVYEDLVGRGRVPFRAALSAVGDVVRGAILGASASG